MYENFSCAKYALPSAKLNIYRSVKYLWILQIPGLPHSWKAPCRVFLWLIVNGMDTSQGKFNLHFSYINYEVNIHTEFVQIINISEASIYFARAGSWLSMRQRTLNLRSLFTTGETFNIHVWFIYFMFVCAYACICVDTWVL